MEYELGIEPRSQMVVPSNGRGLCFVYITTGTRPLSGVVGSKGTQPVGVLSWIYINTYTSQDQHRCEDHSREPSSEHNLLTQITSSSHSSTMSTFEKSVSHSPISLIWHQLMKDGRSPGPSIGSTTDLNQFLQSIPPTEGSFLKLFTDPVSRPMMLSHLAWSLLRRFEHTKRVTDLERAIRASRDAVEGLSPNHLNGSVIRTLQSLLFLRRSQHCNTPADFQKSVIAIHLAIENIPRTHPDAFVLSIILHTLLIKQFNHPKPNPNTKPTLPKAPHQKNPSFVKEFLLSVPLVEMFEATGDRKDLDKAIQHCRRAVAAAPPDHPQRPIVLAAMALALDERWFHFGALQDQEEGFQVCEEALIVPQLHAWTVQARLLERRFQRFGDIHDLEQAVRAIQDAAAAAPPGHRERLLTLDTLGSVLITRFLEFGDMDDLDKAIGAIEEALVATPIDETSRPARQYALSEALTTRYKSIGSEEDIEKAIAAGEAAVAATSSMHRALGERLESLSGCYRERFNNSGAEEDLVKAVDASERALRSTPASAQSYARVLHELSQVLRAKFEYSGELEDLTNAIRRSEQVLAALPSDHRQRIVAAGQLGELFSMRFDRFGALNDLLKAIHASEESLAATPTLHLSRANRLQNHSSLLFARFRRVGDIDDLRKSWMMMLDSCSLTPTEHLDRPIKLNNLSLRYSTIFFHSGATVFLQQAIEFLDEAVGITPVGHPLRPTMLMNLGDLFAAKFLCSDHTPDRDLANRAIEEAVASIPLDNPSRGILLLGMARVYRLTDVAKSLAVYLEAWNCCTLPPRRRIDAASIAAKLLIVERRWEEASKLLGAAVNKIPEVSSRLLSREDLQYLLAKYSALAGDAMAIALQAGMPAWSTLSLLELGRGIIMGYAIDCRSDLSDLGAQNPALYTKLSNLRIEIDSPFNPTVPYQSTDEDQRRHRVQAIDEMNETLTAVREVPGFEGFQIPASSESLLTMAAEEGPVVIVNATEVRSDAIIVTRTGIKSLNLARLKRSDVVDRMERLARLVRGKRSTYAQRNLELFEILSWLWEVAVEPVFEDLGFAPVADGGEYPRVWWIGVGPLATAPFHAAGDHSTLSSSRNTLCRAISSYIPTLKALSYARQKKLELRSNPNSRLLMVTMPVTADTPAVAESNLAPGTPIRKWSPLTNAAVEADGIIAVFHENNRTVTRLDTPIATEVLEMLPDYHAIHFVCHGVSEARNPSNSHLRLCGDPDRITVQDISNRNIKNAQIAYLSACCSAHNSSAELPNESIHIASGFQLAGFSHVLGMMWPSGDLACCQVAVEFYRLLFNGDGDDGHRAVSVAYHHSVRKWRNENLRQPIKWATFIHTGA